MLKYITLLKLNDEFKFNKNNIIPKECHVYIENVTIGYAFNFNIVNQKLKADIIFHNSETEQLYSNNIIQFIPEIKKDNEMFELISISITPFEKKC